MRGVWFGARHRRRLWQGVMIARAARDEETTSRARKAARSARNAKQRLQRTGGVSRALLDQETVAAVSEVFEQVAATLLAVDERRQKLRRRRRLRRVALGVTLIGGAAVGAWRYGRRTSSSAAV
jgi:hypothetical protein